MKVIAGFHNKKLMVMEFHEIEMKSFIAYDNIKIGVQQFMKCSCEFISYIRKRQKKHVLQCVG